MKRLPSDTPHRSRRPACWLAAVAAVTLGGAASAEAQVRFPAPDAMHFTDLPSRVRAGATFTLHEVMPLAIFAGEMRLQRQSPSGGWSTIASAPPRPKVFWLHWRVPARWGGSQLAVRFVLDSHGQMLAVSPTYALSVTASPKRGRHR
jgi:hypothetical protein